MRVAVFVVALIARIAAIEATGAERITFGDGPDYIATAASLCSKHVYPERGNLPFFRAPGLPLFVAAVTACHPSRTRAIKYGLAVCDALTALLIFSIARLLYESRRVAVIAGMLAALHPLFIAAVTDIRGEPLFTLFLVSAIFFVLRGNPALAGVALGLASLTRPTALLCIPLFALFMWRKRAAVLIAAALLTLAPWTVRNAVRFGELIVVNDAGGFNFWRGTHPELLRIVRMHDREAFAKASWNFETLTAADATRVVESRASSPGARDRLWTRLALQNIRNDPAGALRATAWKAVSYWRPWLHPAEHGARAMAISAIVFLGLYVLGAAGLAKYPDRRIVAAVVIFFAAMWLAHLPYLPSVRLRMPLTDPLLIVFAAGAIAAPRKNAPSN